MEAADEAVAVGIPVYFRPYRLSTKRTGLAGSGSFKFHIMPHPYPTLNVSPATVHRGRCGVSKGEYLFPPSNTCTS